MSGVSHNPKGLLTVISGPSGVGKTTIVKQVKDRLDAMFSISATTRPKTDQETDQVDYHFLDEAKFNARVEGGEFLEYACVFKQHSYGTPRKPVQDALAQGKLVILEIDVQGGIQVRASIPDALLIFIMPPTEEVLLERLEGRGRDSEEAIARRYAEAKNEIAKAETSEVYNSFVVNDDLETAIDETCAIIRKRRGH